LIEEIAISLKEGKNEKNEYSSYYNILCNLDKVYEYAGEKLDEEDMNEDVNEEYIESIFMKWNSDEIRFYYELKWK